MTLNRLICACYNVFPGATKIKNGVAKTLTVWTVKEEKQG